MSLPISLPTSLPTPHFTEHAHGYDLHTPIQTAVAQQLAAFIYDSADDSCGASSHSLAAQTWLDVGCGTGKLSQAILSYWQDKSQPNTLLPFGQLYGLDCAASMLAYWQHGCQQFLNAANQSAKLSLKSYLADMTALPFAGNSIDTIISSFALHWTSPNTIAELARVLKPSGQMHLAIPVAGSLSAVSERFRLLPIYPFLPSQDWQAAIALLLACRDGQYLYCHERCFRHTYAHLGVLLKNLKQMGGTVSGLPPVSVAVLRGYLQDKNPIDLDYQVLMVGVRL